MPSRALCTEHGPVHRQAQSDRHRDRWYHTAVAAVCQNARAVHSRSNRRQILQISRQIQKRNQSRHGCHRLYEIHDGDSSGIRRTKDQRLGTHGMYLIPTPMRLPPSPAEERGTTLIELLVAMLTGIVVLFALLAILEFSTNQDARISDRVQANRLG